MNVTFFLCTFVVLLCLLLVVHSQQQINSDSNLSQIQETSPTTIPNITFYIEQRGSDNEFHARTRIQLIPKPDGRNGLLYLDKNTIHGEDVKYFKSLIRKEGRSALYTIRIRSEKEDFKGNFVTTSIPVVSSLYFLVLSL
jgi:hypothetical protein